MRRLVRPFVFTVVSVSALVAFAGARRWMIEPVDWRDLDGWLGRVEPSDTLVEVARWLGLVLAAYVALVSVTALVAEATALVRVPRLTRLLRDAVGVVAIPALRRRLVEVTAAAAITTSSLQVSPVGAAPAATAVAAVVAPAMDQMPVGLRGDFEGFGVAAGPAAGDATLATYLVVPGDTLWDICGRHYGGVDGALLRTVAAANPQVVDTDLIQPGWRLVLPPVEPAPRPAVQGESTWSVVTVARGDTLWDIVDRHYGAANAELVWAVVESNPEITDPGRIYTGQQITLPAVGGEAPEPPPPQPPPDGGDPNAGEPVEVPVTTIVPAPAPRPIATAPPTTHPADPAPIADAIPIDVPATVASSAPTPLPASATSVASSIDVDEREDEQTVPMAVVIGWTGGAGLAAALIGLAARRRRRRPTRQRHVRPTTQAVQLAVAMHETDNVSLVEWSANAMRTLAAGVRPRPGEATPVPRLVRLAGDHVEIVWDTPNVDIVEPWMTTDGGWSWNLNRDTALQANDGPAPCPLLITIGRHGQADVLINLESCGALAITGEPAMADALARSITTELGANAFADAPTVLTVGIPVPAADPPHLRQVDVSEAIGFLRDRAESAGALLAHRRLTSLFALRARSKPHDAHEPVVVMVDPAAVADLDLATLVGLANGDLGAVVVTRGEHPSVTWRLDCSPSEAKLEPLGLRLEPVGLPESLDLAVAEFVPGEDVAADDIGDEDGFEEDDADAAFVLNDHLTLIAIEQRAEPIPEPVEEGADWDVELKVLGQVRAVGTGEPLSPTELHLAIYLAFHRTGQNADTIATMVWPQGCAKRTVTNTMAFLRRKLGNDPGGEPLYPLARDSQYLHRLSPRVVTDWDRFVALAKRAEALPDDEALPLLDNALGLVEGAPFQANTGYSWAYSDGTATLIAETIKATAKRSAVMHIAKGEMVGAAAAAGAALTAIGAAPLDLDQLI